MAVQGYDTYITVFYIITAITLATLALTVWVALVLKGSDTVNPWLRRWANCAGRGHLPQNLQDM